ncbi:MAG: type II toxin-antitoxin system VapB family antitoxin [Polyangiaceae bacterium]
MKTTIDISDALFERAKRLASKECTTLRELIEAGLRRELDERRAKKPFVLRDASVDGTGLQPEFQGATWEQLRDAAYERRGA